MERITTAVAGQPMKLKLRATGNTTDETVLAPCEQKDNGCWYCITHQEGFQNNFYKDSHIERGKHQLVWVCFAHGPGATMTADPRTAPWVVFWQNDSGCWGAAFFDNSGDAQDYYNKWLGSQRFPIVMKAKISQRRADSDAEAVREAAAYRAIFSRAQ